MNLSRKSIAFVAMTVLALACATPALANGHKTVKYDIAMNGLTFSFEGATNPAGFPAVGTPFIITGYIYPGGTFKKYGSGSGVREDGSPEFPDRVLGTWYCRGWHLQDGDALTGPVVATTQVFEFKARVAGSKQLITDGIELADFGVWFERSITGGTGPFRSGVARVNQIYVAFNATNSFNTSFAIEVR
jgi:hypothetical protein